MITLQRPLVMINEHLQLKDIFLPDRVYRDLKQKTPISLFWGMAEVMIAYECAPCVLSKVIPVFPPAAKKNSLFVVVA